MVFVVVIKRFIFKIAKGLLCALRESDKSIILSLVVFSYAALRIALWPLILWYSVVKFFFFTYRSYFVDVLILNAWGFLKDLLHLYRYVINVAFLLHIRYKVITWIKYYFFDRPDAFFGLYKNHYYDENQRFFKGDIHLERVLHKRAERRRKFRAVSLKIKKKVDSFVDYPWRAMCWGFIYIIRTIPFFIRLVRRGVRVVFRVFKSLHYGLSLAVSKRKYYIYYGISEKHLRSGDIPGFVLPEFGFDFYKHEIVERKPLVCSESTKKIYHLNEKRAIS